MSAKPKSKSPIICGGVACVVAVACLTGAAVNMVLNKVNDNADKAYAEAVQNVQNAQLVEWQAEQDRLAQLEKSSSDTTSSDKNEDKPIESSPNDIKDSVDVDKIDDVPYIGTDYVTIDIDGNMVYRVQKGDTLTKISNLTGYSVQELAKYNHIENVNLIYTNQSIRIPASQAAIDYVLQYQNNGIDSDVTIQPVN